MRRSDEEEEEAVKSTLTVNNPPLHLPFSPLVKSLLNDGVCALVQWYHSPALLISTEKNQSEFTVLVSERKYPVVV